MFTAQFCFHSASECSLIINQKDNRDLQAVVCTRKVFQSQLCSRFTICSSLQLLKMRTMRNPIKNYLVNGKFNLFDAFSFKSFYCKRIIVKVYYFIFLETLCYFRINPAMVRFAFMFLKISGFSDRLLYKILMRFSFKI